MLLRNYYVPEMKNKNIFEFQCKKMLRYFDLHFDQWLSVSEIRNKKIFGQTQFKTNMNIFINRWLPNNSNDQIETMKGHGNSRYYRLIIKQ